jgi:hypothetical protein
MYEKTISTDCNTLCLLCDQAARAQFSHADVHTLVWQACEHVVAGVLTADEIVQDLVQHTVVLADEIYACHLSRCDDSAMPLISSLTEVVAELVERLPSIIGDRVHWQVKQLDILYGLSLRMRLHGWDEPFDQPVPESVWRNT